MSENWTTENIPDLTGKIIIVTGANSGIGFEASKELARKGADTILASRNLPKAQAALNKLIAEIPDAPIRVMQLDLASLDSIRQFAAQFKDNYERLDILVNNAGIMAVPYAKTADGFESQFGTNHLGHFALTGLLIDLILNTVGSRVVNVSSNAHHRGVMDFNNLMYDDGKDYSPGAAYGRSKLANLLFTYELQRRLEAIGSNTIAVAAHPGITATNLADHMFPDLMLRLLKPVISMFLQKPAMGALPTLRAALDPDLMGGEYFGPDDPNERRGYPVLVQSNDASHNMDDARRLWQVSEELTGVHYL